MPSGTGESNEMLEHVKAWTKEVQKSGRLMRPFVLTPNGDTVLVSRYLAPIEPPEEIFPEGNNAAMKNLILQPKLSFVKISRWFAVTGENGSVGSLRFPVPLPSWCVLEYFPVHAVVYPRRKKTFPTEKSLSRVWLQLFRAWSLMQVFVNTPGGGREDHSVLLASFFLHLGVKTYIIQGENIDGPTTHLLTTFKKTGEPDTGTPKSSLLWNPSAGTHTRVNHTLSSLHKVWTAIGPFNVRRFCFSNYFWIE